nr:unnamed protein product [Callosobruchus chinensis]
MADIEILKNKRKQVKSKLTRFKTYFSSNKGNFNAENVEELRLRLEHIQGCLDEFNEIQNELELLRPSSADDEERDSFEKTYFEIVAEARSVCATFENFVSPDKGDSDKRINRVKNKKLCTICFKPSHPSWKCKSRKCIKCNKPHNSLLHFADNSENIRKTGSSEGEGSGDGSNPLNGNMAGAADASTAVANSVDIASCTSDSPVAEQVLLSTAMIKIKSGDTVYTVCALLDSGSQSNFITEALCNKLNLPKYSIEHTVKGVGQAAVKIKNRTNVDLFAIHDNFKLTVDCLVIPKITEKLPMVTFDKKRIEIPQHVKMADPCFNDVKKTLTFS